MNRWLPVIAFTLFACDSGGSAEDQLSLAGRRARATAPPAPGSPAAHDPQDSEGEGTIDRGNPNANAQPSAPRAPESPGTATSQLAISLSLNTPTVSLGGEVAIDVALTPANGFSGPVDVSVAGLPAGVTAAPLHADISGPQTMTLKLQAAIDAPVTAPNVDVPLVVNAQAGAGTASANANFKVLPKLELVIPVNVDALRAANVMYRDEWGAAFGASPKALLTQPGNGIVVTVFNADSKPHIIHGNNGFAHGDTGRPIQPNAFEMNGGSPRTRTLGVGTDCNGYPHDGAQGPGASFRIRVEATD